MVGNKVKTPVGMVTSNWYPITAEPDNAHPTYAEAVDMGAAVKGYLTITTASSEIPGDDIIQVSADEFVSCQADVETTLDDLELNSMLYGHTYSVESGEVSNAADSAKPGAYSFIQSILKKDKTKVFRGTILFKCTAVSSSEKQEADTKKPGELSPKMNAVQLKCVPDNSGAWRQRKEFDTQEATEEWIGSILHPAGA